MEFLTEYGVFLAETITIVIAILIVITAVGSAAMKNKKPEQKEMLVEKVNDKLKDIQESLESTLLDKDQLKEHRKSLKEAQKQKKKSKAEQNEKNSRVFVLNFNGDIKASDVDCFRESITAVLQIVNPAKDEIVVKLESPGGMVHSYGLAAAQLDRIKKKGIKLTACVDKVAASGGYMMACVADKIVASPFAIMGSIGVVAQLPNFSKILKKNDIDYEILTAGKYKRTLTMFGENTEEGREKFKADLEDTHELFKSYVAERRPSVDIENVANGDIWFGTRALEVSLVDELKTSDEYVTEACDRADVFTVEFKDKKHLMDKLGIAISTGIEKSVSKVLSELNITRGMR
ncbi:MAG: serine protease SohB [Oleiphilaceae bacterium]